MILTKTLKKCVPYATKVWLREKVLNFYAVPWNRHGVPAPLVARFGGHPGLNIIDIGASKGDFTDSLGRFCTVKKALLVEIQPRRCEELRQRFAHPSFQVLCCAVGDQEGEIEIDILEWDYSTSLLKIDRANSNLGKNDFSVRERIKSKVRTLDNICREMGYSETIDLLKLDVQGAEGMVLAGAGETLRRVQAVWTEVSFRPLYEGSVTFADIYAMFDKLGFRLMALEDAHCGVDGELLQADALFVRINEP